MSNLIRRLRGKAPLVNIDLPGLPRFRMETHGRSDACVSRSIEDWGRWEPNSTAVVRQLLTEPADFIDIGANIGWYTLVAAHALAGRGHVHSFEPDPAHAAKLRANLVVNRLDNVTVNEVALSDRAATATLHLDAHNRGDNSLLPLSTRHGSATVEVTRLDTYGGLAGERPLVIKIDVQGSEIDVLNGAMALLEAYPREVVLVVEVSPAMLAAGGRSVQDLAGLLDSLGFAAAIIDRPKPRILPMSWERLVGQMAAEEARNPDADRDVVAYRRIDGLMAPFFGTADRSTARAS